MTTTTTELVPGYLDVTRLVMASFLARYREPTLTAYTQDLRVYLGWCQTFDREVLRVTRGELEMYVRYLESREYAAATVARRFGTVAIFYKYAVIDGTIPANPATAVSRPRVAWEGQKRTVLHPLEFAALLAAARCSGPNDHALVCLLGMLGLRVSEACGTDITDLRYEAGYELLHVLGKGAKPADIPLPIPVLRAVREVIDCRTTGPILRTRTGRRMDRAGASRALTRVAHAAGITRPISPHGLRRTFCTTGLVAGISIRDMQYAMRHHRPAHHHALRHGQSQPRPPRRPRRGRLPRRHEHRLRERRRWRGSERNRHYRTNGHALMLVSGRLRAGPRDPVW